MINYDPLWRTLAKKKMTKTQLREEVGFTTTVLAKLSKNEYVSIRIIDEICSKLHLHNLNEIVEYVEDINTILDEIKNIIDDLKIMNENPQSHNNKTFVANQMKTYLIIKELLDNHAYQITTEQMDTLINLYAICIQNKLLPDDLINNINKSLSNESLKTIRDR